MDKYNKTLKDDLWQEVILVWWRLTHLFLLYCLKAGYNVIGFYEKLG